MQRGRKAEAERQIHREDLAREAIAARRLAPLAFSLFCFALWLVVRDPLSRRWLDRDAAEHRPTRETAVRRLVVVINEG